MSTVRHFLDIRDFDGATLRAMLKRASALKAVRAGLPRGAPDPEHPLNGQILAMIFEKSSTRTRVSFDVGMRQLGGESIVLNAADMQLGRGETVADTARVLSRMVDAIMLRTFEHAKLKDMAAHADVPVINALTDDSHPCQLMADVMTYEEHRGPIEGRIVAWFGDGNNMTTSWIEGASRFGYRLRLACPPELLPAPAIIEAARAEGAQIEIVHDAAAAAEGADILITDTWLSMGDEAGDKHNLLKPYQVTQALMDRAREDAVFMHCLPAHRGEEVTAEVIDGPRSIVFDEAENRIHAQKGILSWCLLGR